MSQQHHQQQQIIEQAVLQTAKQLENQLDKQIEQYNVENLDEDDFEQLRRQRLAQLKKQQAERNAWSSNGHGKMNEIPDEKSFFESCKTSRRVVALFSNSSNPYCKILEEHLTRIAQQHMETKFLVINAEKSPFLVDRLKIWMIPTVVLIVDQKTEYSIVGLDELNKGEYDTKDLEKLLVNREIIYANKS